MNTSEIVASVSLGISTLAFFVPLMTKWYERAKLDLAITCEPPDCNRIMTGIPVVLPGNKEATIVNGEVYYFRLRIRNVGKIAAKCVQVFASELVAADNKSDSRVKRRFFPMSLTWSHRNHGHPEKLTMSSIAPDAYAHSDLGTVVDPSHISCVDRRKTIDITDERTPYFTLATVFDLNTGASSFGPGLYLLKIAAMSDNTKTVVRTIRLSLRSAWFPEESDMLTSHGCFVELLPRKKRLRLF